MSITKGLPATFNPEAYDVIVVGAGYAGAVCARRLAEACGSKVAVIERRNHIAGNAYDCVDEAGVLIHQYGPHIYHTTNDRVHEFLSRFTEWTNYQHKVLANIHGTLMPVPFNHKSLKLAFGEEKGEHLYQKLVSTFGENKKVPIMELRSKNDPELTEVADYVYENIFLYYTMKQWGKTPTRLTRRSRVACPSSSAMTTGTSLRHRTRACPPRATRASLSVFSTTTWSTSFWALTCATSSP